MPSLVRREERQIFQARDNLKELKYLVKRIPLRGLPFMTSALRGGGGYLQKQ